ncbi:transposase [Neorhizobium galegae]|uniref:transposase n=1 Tax=Neorhizobium galegae TaxID=399 RepID=UPI0009BAFAB0
MPEQRGHVFCVASAGRLKTRWQSRQANFVSGRAMGSGHNLFRVKSETAETDASLQVRIDDVSVTGVHRHWPDEVKAQIVPESIRFGAMVNELAERQGLKRNHLSTWSSTIELPGRVVCARRLLFAQSGLSQ